MQSFKEELAQYINTHKGESLKQIARQFEISVSELKYSLDVFGFKLPEKEHKVYKGRILGIDKAEFTEYAREHTAREIAEHFDKHLSNIYDTLRFNQIEYKKVIGNEEVKRTPKFSGDEKDMIRTLSKTYTYASIARVFGYQPDTVRKICVN